jgi:hypothetical protein
MWVPGGVGGSVLRPFEDGVPRLDCIFYITVIHLKIHRLWAVTLLICRDIFDKIKVTLESFLDTHHVALWSQSTFEYPWVMMQ